MFKFIQNFFNKKDKNVDNNAFTDVNFANRVYPCHVAIICDGNGRWAKKRGLQRSSGHIEGAKTIEKIVKYIQNTNIKYITFYIFSTENWKRPIQEVNVIMNLFRNYLNKIIKNLKNNDIKINFLGDKAAFSDEIRALMSEVSDVSASKRTAKLTVNLAVNYGSRHEIVSASRKIIRKVLHGEIVENDITEQFFSNFLYTFNQPDVDLLIRTGGEQRLSNFLLWQSSYAEIIFDDVLWPAFSPRHFESDVSKFLKRNRRFGGV